MSVRLGLSRSGKNIGGRCSRIGVLRKIFGPKKYEVIG
jgi:hypothetical protein